MRDREALDTLRLATEMVLLGVLCVIVIFLTTVSKNLYSIKDEQEAIQHYMKEQGENYFFRYADHIYGSDIVAFIIKYDEVYDYYITLKGGQYFTITKEYAEYLNEQGFDRNILWSQEYLTNKVLKDAIYSEFTVNAVRDNSSINYYISEK